MLQIQARSFEDSFLADASSSKRPDDPPKTYFPFARRLVVLQGNPNGQGNYEYVMGNGGRKYDILRRLILPKLPDAIYEVSVDGMTLVTVSARALHVLSQFVELDERETLSFLDATLLPLNIPLALVRGDVVVRILNASGAGQPPPSIYCEQIETCDVERRIILQRTSQPVSSVLEKKVPLDGTETAIRIPLDEWIGDRIRCFVVCLLNDVGGFTGSGNPLEGNEEYNPVGAIDLFNNGKKVHETSDPIVFRFVTPASQGRPVPPAGIHVLPGGSFDVNSFIHLTLKLPANLLNPHDPVPPGQYVNDPGVRFTHVLVLATVDETLLFADGFVTKTPHRHQR